MIEEDFKNYMKVCFKRMEYDKKSIEASEKARIKLRLAIIPEVRQSVAYCEECPFFSWEQDGPATVPWCQKMSTHLLITKGNKDLPPRECPLENIQSSN